MKLVLDTNVFVSGIFFNGPPFLILQAWRIGNVQLVVSPEILEEYRRVGEILADEHPAIHFEPVLEYVIQNGTLFSALPLPDRVCDDPDDDKFFACALASGSRLIVSGDKHLLSKSGYQKIAVLKPREFLDRHLSE
jgi:putative PIN family toxin of toxin-antitoxin system